MPSVYRWRADDAAFAKRWSDALTLAGDLLEEEADRRGRDGYDVPVYYRGKEVGTKRRYADTLLHARMKAVLPHQYRDGRTTAAVEPLPVTITIREFVMEAEMLRLLAVGKLTLDDLTELPRARLERLRAEAAKSAADGDGEQ